MANKTNINTSVTIFVFLLMIVLLAGATSVYGRVPTILLVSDCSAPGMYTGTPPYDVNERDNTLVWFLEGLGYTVDTSGMNKAYQEGQNPFSDPAKVAALDSADLVLVSLHADSGAYDHYRQNWNELEKSLVLMNGYLTRGGSMNRWGWVTGGGIYANNTTTDIFIEAGQETHLFVAGFTSPITAFDWSTAPIPGQAPRSVYLPNSPPVEGATIIGTFDSMPILMDIPAGTDFDYGNTNGPYGIAGGRRVLLSTWGYANLSLLDRDATFTDFLTDDYLDLFAQTLNELTPSSDTIYVDADAAVVGDGLSWPTAFKYLQDALTIAWPGDEIRVAQGIYKPDANSTVPSSGDRLATFQLIDGVAIKGGYAGLGAVDPNERDIEAYETILSGDINTPGDNSDNSYHVVTGSGTEPNAVLDGFTVTAGNAPYAGGGMYNDMGSPTITNCTFSGNSAGDGGGGMWNYWSSPTVSNCTFSGNSASDIGGGMYNDSNSSPTVANCTFSGNLADGEGGGMYNDSNSSPRVTNCTFSGNSANAGGGMENFVSSLTVTNCTFSENSAGDDGGGMSNVDSSPTITNCTFSGNSASSSSGGGMWNDGSSPALTNCTFSGNSAGNDGGGMSNDFDSSPMLTNCILWGNTAPNGAQIYNGGTSSATVSYSDVEGGWSGTGNINADPLFVDADGPDNTVGTEDDNLRLSYHSPCIDAGDNSAVPAGVTRDIDGEVRFVDDAATPDTGSGTAPIVDMGAHEYSCGGPERPYPLGDVNRDCHVDFFDIAIVASTWLECTAIECD